MRALAVVVALAALAGCSSGGTKAKSARANPPTTAPDVTVAAGSPKTATPGETIRVPGPTTTGAALTLTTFKTPSGNIGCEVGADYTRCDVDQRAWSAPPKPASCEFDWGGGLQISGNGAAEFACASDSVLAAASTVLAYGQRTRQGSTVCDSEQAGVTCTNEASRHGFFLSRDSYRIF